MDTAPSLFTPRERRSVQITITFTHEERDALREYTQRCGITRAQLVRSAVAEYMTAHNAQAEHRAEAA